MLNSWNDNWSTLSNISFDKMFSLGDSYCKFVCRTLYNPFWRDILENWKKYYPPFKIQDLDDDQLKYVYGIKGTFLDYQTLIRKIPRTWKETINENTNKCKDMKYIVYINCYLKFILKDKKSSRLIYDKLVPVNQLQTTNEPRHEKTCLRDVRPGKT